ncbi:hypothetical protein B0H66DRAFT_548918 [Apodospora peruviana]|uniref:rRNA methyltransferase 1, mitochondrial n=1 Tax=Apodospora peruviana TaxID=516989 RepID=A0AAE0IJ04_9PEZI|nr:hypothetical protein B0H66DRAFT_548918 [Apodospora peruviana]
MTLSMLCRPTGPMLAWTKPARPLAFANHSRGKSSLSAIHSALRKSQKTQSARPARPPMLNADGKPMTYNERKAAREALEKPGFKIRKGKKDITIDPTKAKPISRQKRFYDQNNSFAKKSIVHQLKTGKLQNELNALEKKSGFDRKSAGRTRDSRGGDGFSKLEEMVRGAGSDSKRAGRSRKLRGSDDSGIFARSNDSPARVARPRDDERPARDPASSDGPRRRDSNRPSSRRDSVSTFGCSMTISGQDFKSKTEDRSLRDPVRSAREPKSADPDLPSSWSKTSNFFGDSRGGSRPPRECESFRSPTRFRENGGRVGRGDRGDARRPRDSERSRASGRFFERSGVDLGRRSSPGEVDETPEGGWSIPYTTAASQFLYGKSVVEAALRSSRRKLYKFYIYSGERRQNMEKDQALETLAQSRGVTTELVRGGKLKLLDQMSGGRPHNGYILEASPLPQLPVTGLGPLAEKKSKVGFQVVLGHQSAEEAVINGTSDFIATAQYSKTHKPLVVVLDQVLDPGNLGAILRGVSFMGASAVAITKRNSASLTPVALKSSAGASESLTLFSIESLPGFLEESREKGGWEVYAAVPETSATTRKEQLNVYEVEERDPLAKKPCILVVGSEGEGLSRQVITQSDYQVSIPNMSGGTNVDSLNVSVAAGLLCSAFMKGEIKTTLKITKEDEKKVALW